MATDVRGRDAAEAAAPVRAVLRLGLPLLLGALASLMSSVVDTAMMGHYGRAELAAVAASSAVFDVFANVVMAALVAHQILAPRFAGAGALGGIRRSLRGSLRYAGSIALVLAAVTAVFGGRLAALVAGGDDRLGDLSAGYLLARSPALLLLVPYGLLIATFNAHKRTRYALVASVVVNAVNLVLDLLLIYGPGPFPELGAVGNGLATTAAAAAGLGYLAVAATRFPPLRATLRAADPPAADPPAADFDTSVHRLAWPAIVSTAVDYLSLALFFFVLGRAGQSALAGGRIGAELDALAFGVLGALAAAIRILIGRAVGAGDVESGRIHWVAGRRALLAGVLPVALLLAVYPAGVARVFSTDPETVEAGAAAIAVVGVGLPVMAWCLASVSMLRALGRTRWDMYANLAAIWLVQLPVAWLLAVTAELGVTGAFVGLLGYWLARAVAAEALARRALHQTAREKGTQP